MPCWFAHLTCPLAKGVAKGEEYCCVDVCETGLSSGRICRAFCYPPVHDLSACRAHKPFSSLCTHDQ